MLQLKNVSKTYNKGTRSVLALKDINITFEEKGLIFIVGKSGSGKSTMLNIMGGLDKMSKGEVIIDGKSTSKFSSSDFDSFRNFYVGFIFQEFNLIDEISVYENIAISLKIQSKQDDINTIDDVLKMVGLENLGYRKPTELSGGQRQRISVARALVKNPRIILADEPTGALDSNTGDELIATLKDLSEDKLVIVVTHDEDLAVKYGDRIITISDGKIINDQSKEKTADIKTIEQLDKKVIRLQGGIGFENNDQISKYLKENTTNYICINKSIEKTALAYPLTYARLYEQENKKDKFYENDKQYIESKPKKEKLPRIGIRFKETLKMAIASYKRKKVRLALMSVFSVVGILMLIVSSNFSSINRNRILENTIDNEISVVQLKRSEDNNFYNMVYPARPIIRDEDYTFLNTYFSSVNFLKKTKSSYKVKTGIDLSNESSYYLNDFIGAIEVSSSDYLGLKALKGSLLLNDYNSIVISDFAAMSLNKGGFLGKDKLGNFKLIKQENYLDIVDCKILLEDGNYYNINGIFKTNYKPLFDAAINRSNYDYSVMMKFQSQRELYYDYIYVKEGFPKIYAENNISKTTDELVLDALFQNFENNEKNWQRLYINTRTDLSSIDESNILYGNLNAPLTRNEIVVSFELISLLMNSMFPDMGTITTQKITDFVLNTDFLAEVFNDNDYSGYSRQVYNIKAIIDIDDLPVNDVVISDIMIDEIIQQSLASSSLLFNPHDVNSIQKDFAFLAINGLTVTLSNNDSSIMFDQMFGSLSTVFMVIGIIFSIFAFLVILTFMSSSVKQRSKEIGILRSSGARRKDVVLIFFSEIILIVIGVSIAVTILLNMVNNGANNLIGNLFSDLKIFKISLLEIIKIFTVTFSFFTFASLIPLMGIIYKSPINNINKE